LFEEVNMNAYVVWKIRKIKEAANP